MRAAIGLLLVSCIAGCAGDDAPATWLPDGFPTGFVEVRGCRASAEHFPRIRISASMPAAAAYDAGPYPLPPGTLLVKEEFSDAACTARTGYTLMHKVPGFDPAGGDWAYQRLDAKGRVVESESGRNGTQRCVSCHAPCRPRDFVCAE